MRVLPVMTGADPNLTIATKQAAEAASDVAARDWCEMNYQAGQCTRYSGAVKGKRRPRLARELLRGTKHEET